MTSPYLNIELFPHDILDHPDTSIAQLWKEKNIAIIKNYHVQGEDRETVLYNGYWPAAYIISWRTGVAETFALIVTWVPWSTSLLWVLLSEMHWPVWPQLRWSSGKMLFFFLFFCLSNQIPLGKVLGYLSIKCLTSWVIIGFVYQAWGF